MNLRALCSCLAAALGFVAACGGSGSSPPDDGTGGAVAADNPRIGADNKGGAQSTIDADCPAGFACKNVGVGEIVVQSCVQTPDASSSADASSPVDSGILIVVDEAGPPDAAPPVDAALPDGGVALACSNQLTVTIASVLPYPRPKCTLNTTVDTSGPATLSYPCSGGPASVTFGAQTFTGTDATGSVTVQNKSGYSMTSPFLGHVTCHIDATQTISGTLASGTLQYTYTEVLTPGQSTLCPLAFLPCSGTGTVAVQ
jgi:hypothetical protein